MRPFHIVFTTIYHPIVLNDLFLNIAEYGHLEEVKVWVVGDNKTPASCAELSSAISKKGLETTYLNIEAQDEWGKRCLEFYKRIPYNNETRRNIGYLHALEDGCEILISIDDDNYPTEHDFIAAHGQTGNLWGGSVLHEASGFHNLCEYLRLEPDRSVHPRGFPFRLRGETNNPSLQKKNEVTIGVTAGLWLNDPDIDAATWINGKVVGKAYLGNQVQVLEQSTWTPVNTQNTSVIRELIPAFLCIPMGWDVPGGKIQRYGDIWGGYLLQAVLQNSKYHVAFGHPIVNHNRNPHDYIDDLRFEYWGMILTDWFVEQLRTRFKPDSDVIVDRIDELVLCLEETIISQLPDWCPQEVRGFMHWTSDNLSHWAATCRQLG